jgi:hypothetical protein
MQVLANVQLQDLLENDIAAAHFVLNRPSSGPRQMRGAPSRENP